MKKGLGTFLITALCAALIGAVTDRQIFAPMARKAVNDTNLECGIYQGYNNDVVNHRGLIYVFDPQDYRRERTPDFSLVGSPDLRGRLDSVGKRYCFYYNGGRNDGSGRLINVQ